jgi:hypothetical protein
MDGVRGTPEGGFMKPTLRAGIVLGLAVVVWTFIFGFAGWHKDPAMSYLWWVVILIQAGVITWGLTLTRAEGKRYGGQLLSGTLISIYGGIIIIFGSLLFTMVVFPNYFDELSQMQAELLAQRGMTADQIEQTQALTAKLQTPVANAVIGFVMTLITGFILSLILAAVIRKKD